MGILDPPLLSRPATLLLGSRGNGLIAALGDSITANDYTAPTSTTGHKFLPRSYLMHAVLLSGGRLRFGGIAATGGYTSAQIVATHLPTILALRPQFCVVHAGTNDSGTLTQAQTLVNLRTVYTALLAAGITPIATTLLPKQTAVSTQAANLQQVSIWIKREAQRLGIPCIDWRSMFTNNTTDGWMGYGVPGTYNLDDTHPNVIGAEVMGQSIVDILATLLPAGKPWLVTSNTQSGALPPSSTNGLMQVDGNADGIPDSWATSGTVPTGSTFALSAVAPADGLGNWFRIHRDAAGTGTLLVLTSSITLVPGHRMYVGIKVKTTGVSAGSLFDLRFTDAASTAAMWELFTWSRDIVNPAVFAAEFVVPTGVVTGSWRANLRSPCDVYIAQPTVYDLTALGLDT